MSENYDPIDLLLAASEELLGSPERTKTLKETDLFQQETNVPRKPLATTSKNSLVHSGDTDSSDDEDRRNWEDRRYTENGREMKKLLDTATSSTKIGTVGTEIKRISHSFNWKKPPQPPIEKEKIINTFNPRKVVTKLGELPVKSDVYTDPVFGIRIVNPLVSSAVLQDRMVGREPITFIKLNRFLQMKTKDKDWVLAGVVVNKTAPKTSQKGNQFSVWTLTDLKDDIKTISVFLFSGAHQQLWKTAVGTVVGLLNPNVLEKKDGKDEASLSIDNGQKVMILGQSKDFGTCRSVKKNGDKCTAIVNTNRCEYCIYHIKQEYQKCSIRSDLQSSFGGRGLTALRNKVLGKNEVFYAGKSYTAIPAKKSRKQEQKDTGRLDSLFGKTLQKKSVPKSGTQRKCNAPRLEVSHAQRLKDLKMIEKLNGVSDLSEKTSFEGKQSTDVTLEDAKSLANSVLSKLKAKKHNVGTSNHGSAGNDIVGKHSSDISLGGTKSLEIPILDEPKSKAEEKVDTNSITDKIPPTNNGIDAERLQKSPKIISSDISRVLNASSDHSLNVNGISGVKKITEDSNLNKSLKSGPFDDYKPKNSLPSFPKLSGFDAGCIDFSKPITPGRKEKAKLNAIKLIQKTGPIKKVDPNNSRGTGVKRPIEVDGEKIEVDAKKPKVETNSFTSERFKKMMAATSSHLDLLEARDEEEKEKYFHKLEVKEKMEEKMIGTHKLACKAVKCLQCKYTSFSASELCKSERHPLKVFDAVKRFYKCGHCQNRIVCLEVVPLRPCDNCGSMRWEKTGMMKDKVVTAAHSLSIRGGEQKHLNSVATDASLNLLVPD